MSGAFCQDGQLHQGASGGLFCTRCGAPTPSSGSGEWRNDWGEPTESQGAALRRQRALQSAFVDVVAWAASDHAIFAVRRTGQNHVLLRIDAHGGVRDLGAVKSPETFVTPMLAGPRGAYLVYRDQVVVCSDEAIRPIDAPSGTRLTGATVGTYGELWVTAVSPDKKLWLLALGVGDWRQDATTAIPNFGVDPGFFLALAVRSRAPFKGEAIIWGGGQVAVVVDRAIPILRRHHEAPELDALLRNRGGVAPIDQGIWAPNGARLVTAIDNQVRVLRLVDDALTVTPIKGSTRPILAAALTASGRLYVRLKDAVLTDDGRETPGPAQLDLDRPAQRVVSAKALGETAVFVEGGDDAFLAAASATQAHAKAVEGAASPLTPPLVLANHLWRLFQADGEVRLARHSLASRGGAR